jgi:hypothetical protein
MALDNIPTLGPGSLNSNLDKVLVYKNGGSEVAVSLLTLTNSALNLSGVYLDTVNGRMGIGTPSPTVALDIYSAFTSSAMLKVFNGYTSREACVEFRSQSNQMYFGGAGLFVSTTAAIGTIDSLPARLGIKGSGSTSATTSLLVQNSSGNTIFSVRDDGRITLNTENAVFGPNGPTIDGSNCIIYRGGYNTESIAFNLSRLNFTDSNGFVFSSSSYSATLTASSIVDIQSTTKGFLKPRLTTVQKNAIVTPAAGLEIYDTDLNRPCFYNGTSWITL